MHYTGVVLVQHSEFYSGFSSYLGKDRHFQCSFSFNY